MPLMVPPGLQPQQQQQPLDLQPPPPSPALMQALSNIQPIQSVQPGPVQAPLMQSEPNRTPVLAGPATGGAAPGRPVLDFRSAPSFARGGPVPMPGQQRGMPPRSGARGQRLDGARMVGMIRQQLMQRLQSGKLKPQALNIILQMFIAARQNPALYDKLRQAAIAKGIAGPNSLPPTYDPGIVMAFIQAASDLLRGSAGAPPQRPPAQMAVGGHVPMTASPTGDNTGKADDIPIRVSGGEYVIPKNVVEMKGREFFDGLLKKYTEGEKG